MIDGKGGPIMGMTDSSKQQPLKRKKMPKLRVCGDRSAPRDDGEIEEEEKYQYRTREEVHKKFKQ